MDAPESDHDVKLQMKSGDLIAKFDKTLPTFLRKPDGHGGSPVRSSVRTRELYTLINSYLDPFLELPQLLDPHLSKWIPILAEAYLEQLQSHRLARERSLDRANDLVSVEFAICKLLYTLCKIRGETVVVRFLNVETRYLEVLLSAILEAERLVVDHWTTGGWDGWRWEQRYVTLLWLSHLFLAPFDLSTISSVDADDVDVPSIPGMDWPENLPGIALRAIPLAIKYLASPGKERDAAKVLLVRIAMRRDMQQLGVLDSLIRWSLASLRPQKDVPQQDSYLYIGVLSFLAGALRASSDTSDMDKYLSAIFRTVYAIAVDQDDLSKRIISIALARKMMLKVMRSVIVDLLRRPSQDGESTELIEIAIGHLLESLADNDTPVRLSASKSLSIITLKLDPGMASQVVEAVLEALNRNVLWTKPAGASDARPVRDLSSVSHLEWHGLMLTLSHLLFRRSPPAKQLSDIVHALILGLSFEQRSTSGTSVGTNVRDAACFGIWALARRYTTEELLAVPTESVFAAKAHPPSSSVLQVLGTELVTSACLDPAGNIRRGASAALQELIGRHPDTIEKGISVVQEVDYHAVARRSRAMEQVALGVTKLASQYGVAIADGILGWRGVGDVNAPSRRDAAVGFGVLTAALSSSAADRLAQFKDSLDLVTERLGQLQNRQVEERHSLLLCFAAVVDQFAELVRSTNGEGGGPLDVSTVDGILRSATAMLHDCKTTTYRRPELVAEAASRVVVSLVPVLQAAVLGTTGPERLETMQRLVSTTRADPYSSLVSALDSTHAASDEIGRFVTELRSVLPLWLDRSELETIEPVSEAALTLLIFSNPKDRDNTLRDWAAMVRHRPKSRTSQHGNAYLYSLALAQPLKGTGEDPGDDIVCNAILKRWSTDKDVDTRVAILQGLSRSRVLQDRSLLFLDLISDGLNDYTTNARGDVGSHVRVQALKAVQCLWANLAASSGQDEWVEASVRALFHSVLRLAAEKLDRVRPEAKAVLALVLTENYVKRFQYTTFSSKGYFQTLLRLYSSDMVQPRVADVAKADAAAWMSELLVGYVTSADTGNEDLVIASRAALCDFCEAAPANLDTVCRALLRNLQARQGGDRVVVPTLELVAFLFHVGLFQRSAAVDLRGLCLQTQKAGYKTGNVRKIEACVKVYGGVAGLERGEDEGPREARRRLGALMYHPWPRVRNVVVDELWGLQVELEGGGGEKLVGVDWGTAEKGQIRTVVEELGLA